MENVCYSKLRPKELFSDDVTFTCFGLRERSHDFYGQNSVLNLHMVEHRRHKSKMFSRKPCKNDAE